MVLRLCEAGLANEPKNRLLTIAGDNLQKITTIPNRMVVVANGSGRVIQQGRRGRMVESQDGEIGAM